MDLEFRAYYMGPEKYSGYEIKHGMYNVGFIDTVQKLAQLAVVENGVCYAKYDNIPFELLRIMQRTDFKDVRGNKIYHGDIIQIEFSTDDTKFFEYIPVEWSAEDGAFIFPLSDGNILLASDIDFNYCKIEGNVYEHFELLQPHEDRT